MNTSRSQTYPPSNQPHRVSDAFEKNQLEHNRKQKISFNESTSPNIQRNGNYNNIDEYDNDINYNYNYNEDDSHNNNNSRRNRNNNSYSKAGSAFSRGGSSSGHSNRNFRR